MNDKEPAIFLQAVERRYHQGETTLEILSHADFAVWAGFRQVRVGTLSAGIPADSWHRLSCGDGAKGPRVYDWAVTRTNSPEPDEYSRWVLIRRIPAAV